MLDMSKAFDSMDRQTLLNDLRHTIDADELHIISSLLNVTLSVKCGDTLSEEFNTDTGGPQGDCASANEFTYYLAKAIPPDETMTDIHDHTYSQPALRQNIPYHLSDHNYAIITQIRQIDIDMQYADDISKITSDYNSIQHFKKIVPEKLKTRDLKINQEKTEEYTISKTRNEWRKCKFLGSLLDTSEDIKRRKMLAINAANKISAIFENKRLTIKTKMKAFDAYIKPIFLYNCEIWTITASCAEKMIDGFQRRLLRTYVLNVKWPKILKTKKSTQKQKRQNGAKT